MMPDLAQLLANRTAAAAVEQRRANEAVRVAEIAKREAEDAVRTAERAAEVARDLQGMQGERDTIDSHKLGHHDLRQSIRNKESELREAKAGCEKQEAELGQREAEFDQKLLYYIQLSAKTSAADYENKPDTQLGFEDTMHMDMPTSVAPTQDNELPDITLQDTRRMAQRWRANGKKARPAKIRNTLRRNIVSTCQPPVDQTINITREVPQAPSRPEQAQSEDSALDVAFAGEFVQIKTEASSQASSQKSAAYERVGTAIGLDNVSFSASQPIINADGAVASRFQVTYGASKDYQTIIDESTHILDREGYLYALSCAVNGCGANAPIGKPGNQFFQDMSELLAHCRIVHTEEWVRDGWFKIKQLTPVTPMDLALMIVGKMPSRLVWNTGKICDESEQRDAGASLTGEGRLAKPARKNTYGEISAGEGMSSVAHSDQTGTPAPTENSSSYSPGLPKTLGNLTPDESISQQAPKRKRLILKLRLPKATLKRLA